MATNAAMGITGLILGLKPVPEISFQEYVLNISEIATDQCPGSALVILYLLLMSWIVVIASLASCNRLADDTKVLQLVSVIQSYIILVFAFAVLATAPRFGTSPACNQNTFAVIFRPFSALKGRIFGGIVLGLAFSCYTAMTARDYTAAVLNKIKKKEELRKEELRKEELRKEEPSSPPQPQPFVSVFASPTPQQRTKVEARTPRKQVRHSFPILDSYLSV